MSTDQPEKSSATELTPSIWPGAFKAYTLSKQAVKLNLGPVIGLMLLSMLVSIASSMTSPNYSFSTSGTATSSGATPASFLINLAAQLLSVLISAAMIYVLIAGARGKTLSINESLRAGWTKFWPFLGQSILLGLIIIASVILFIVPVFFIAPRLALAPYYLLEGNLDVIDSLKASWAATKGHVGKVWGIVGVNILLVLLAFTVIGIPFAIYFGIMYSAVEVVLYFWITKHGAAQAHGPIIERQ